MVQALKQVRFARWAMLYLLVAAWLLVTAGCMGDRIAVARGLGALVDLQPLLSPPAWLLGGAVYGLAALAFTFSRQQRLAGAFLVFWLWVTGQCEMGVRDDTLPPLANLLSGNLLLAWILALSLPGSPQDRESRGHEWMCGLYGAFMCLAGLNKALRAGWGWFDGGTHSLYIWERAQPMLDLAPLRELRLWMADHPALCTLGASYTILVELLGFCFLVRRLRKPYAIAVAIMFTSMGISLGLSEHGWVAMPMALAFSGLGARRGEEEAA